MAKGKKETKAAAAPVEAKAEEKKVEPAPVEEKKPEPTPVEEKKDEVPALEKVEGEVEAAPAEGGMPDVTIHSHAEKRNRKVIQKIAGLTPLKGISRIAVRKGKNVR